MHAHVDNSDTATASRHEAQSRPWPAAAHGRAGLLAAQARGKYNLLRVRDTKIGAGTFTNQSNWFTTIEMPDTYTMKSVPLRTPRSRGPLPTVRREHGR